ncbi:Sugar or nucleoside kinase, ribokinase family [Paenibacillus sp. UNC496MF]|uniref:carbohydrate kinase family protein n=1 Tax=Paenibacillus sp. UNC496MF TaxID=1502753 RepID=UPI0008EC9174|nr:carbohydrate kinase family protein [Paenibacillus sp. UNC496MF]SFI79947.1 Sugar or nucleoside kinase, ribokinase family [Paenibacillus sp. UNC496MF]
MAKTVYVLGELNVDAIISGSRIHPEPNKEKFVDDFSITLGSSSAITACRLSQLGLNVCFVSVVGDDDFGKYCIERLKRFGVNVEHVRTDPREKTGVTVSLSTPSDRALLTFMGAIPKLAVPIMPDSMMERADHLHFGSFYLQLGMQREWAALFAQAKACGITTSFDAGWDPEENWRRPLIDGLLPVTDLFVPSEEEALRIYGCSDLDELAEALPKRRGSVAVKCGKRGARMLTPEGEWLHEPGFAVKAVDTTGAGDSFNAGLIYSFLEGEPRREQLIFGNACGALSAQEIGGTGGALDVRQARALIAAQRPEKPGKVAME